MPSFSVHIFSSSNSSTFETTATVQFCTVIKMHYLDKIILCKALSTSPEPPVCFAQVWSLFSIKRRAEPVDASPSSTVYTLPFHYVDFECGGWVCSPASNEMACRKSILYHHNIICSVDAISFFSKITQYIPPSV